MALWGGILVLDTSSAIAFIQEAQRPDLFREMAQRSAGLEVPSTVLGELEDPVSQKMVPSVAGVRVLDAEELDSYGTLFNRYPQLGPGELGVIARGIELAYSEEPYTCVLDDGSARSVAERRGLALTGTIGVLLQMEDDGVIDRSEHVEILGRLRDEGFRFDWGSHPLDL